MAWQRWIYTVPLRLRSLFRRKQVDRELEEEFSFHLERQIAEHVAQGLTPADARAAALRALPGLEQRKLECRDARKVNWVQDTAQDLRYGLRTLRKNPGFAAVALFTLALGIGANSAIFSVVNAVLLRPLPYPQPERVFTLKSNQSLPDLEDIQARTRAFDGIAGVNVQRLDYTAASEPIQIYAGLCTSGLFRTLGVQPQLGRAISDEEDQYGARPAVLLSDGFWKRQFGGSPDVVGKSVTLSGIGYTVVGVMPPEFWKPGRPLDVLVSIRVANPVAARFRGVHFLETYFRLAPGVPLVRAQAEMDQADLWLEAHYPEENAGRKSRLIPLQERVVGNIRPALLILFGAVGFLLLIACVNFANLLLARAAGRQKEILTRRALGAAAGRLIRQMLAESVPLAVLGGAFGLLIAWWGIRLLIALKPANLPRLSAVHLDLRVVAFTFGVSVLTGIVFGLLPAIGAGRIDVNRGLKETGRGNTVGAATFRLRKLLVISEVALAMVLLIGAGLLIRSFALLESVNPGFEPGHLLTMRIELPEARYRELATQRRFREQLLASLGAMPGAEAAMISELPMSGEFVNHNFVIEGRPDIRRGEEPELMTRTVAGDYFRTMRIPLLKGRDFSTRDRFGTPHVVVVNEAFARRYFGDRSPIGARIGWARQQPPEWMTVIGVAGDVKHFGLEQPEEPGAYDLYSQTGQSWKRWMYLAIRSGVAPESLAASVKTRLWALDKNLPATAVMTMQEVESGALASRRFNLVLMTLFAIIGLSLAVIGIYGVVAYSVTGRTQEIGIRIALGAQRGRVLRLVMGEYAFLALTGASIGIAASLALTRLMAGLLFGLGARDPLTFAAVVVTLCAVSFIAAYFPARRALRIDPVVALRYE